MCSNSKNTGIKSRSKDVENFHIGLNPGGGGGSLPLEAVTDAREKKTRKKGIQSGLARNAKRVSKSR